MATSLQPIRFSEHDSGSSQDAIARRVRELGDWFHNIDLHGVRTAPDHFLGDYPQVKWKHIAKSIPVDLSGANVLDVGCNGGFYSIELKRRGAERVVAVDVDDRYLNQARFAAETLGVEIEFEKMSVYDIDRLPLQFDYVLFMGLFYHLRYPMFALDKVVKKVKPGGNLVFQTMVRGSMNCHTAREDYDFWDMEVFEDRNFPCMFFIENSYANDQTNWWIPNRPAAEAILRSAGLEVIARPESETWVCAPCQVMRGGQYILDLELEGTL